MAKTRRSTATARSRSKRVALVLPPAMVKAIEAAVERAVTRAIRKLLDEAERRSDA